MAYRTARLFKVWLAALLVLLGAGDRLAMSQVPSSSRAADEKAIRDFDVAFIQAYNKGDVKAIGAMFTEDAEMFEADGARFEGRALIERSFTETFEAIKGAKLSIEIGSIRFLSADTAKEEGRLVVTPPSGTPEARFYTVLYVKKDGRWLMASVREEADLAIRPQERLKALGWMVGEWVDHAPDHEVKVSCYWSKDGSFLLRDFTVSREGKSVMSVHQRIGWDASAGAFRSWEFDSEGGFGEGRWARDGDRWIVKETGVRPDGALASSTRITLKVKADQVRWTLLDRVVGGEAIPGEETSLLTKVPPSAGLGVPATSTPTPKTEGSPR